MALHNINMDSVFRRLADKRIEEAMAEGKFDNLPGAGKPVDLEPLPADENARAMYWALRLMHKNEFTPHEVQYRKQIDTLVDAVKAATTEADVVELVGRVNELVPKLNTMGTNAIRLPVAGMCVEDELRAMRAREIE